MPSRPAAKRNLGRLPKELPRLKQVIEPASLACPCGCGAMVRIGEDVTERLDIVPAQFRVIVTIRPKYACPTCQEGVHQAAAPAHLIEGGLPTEATLAHVLVGKFADRLPLYRQAQIYRRQGIDLDRSTLAGWVGKTPKRPEGYQTGVIGNSGNARVADHHAQRLDFGHGSDTGLSMMWRRAQRRLLKLLILLV